MRAPAPALPIHTDRSVPTSVRFLDNFSAGTRGSASAEHFLRTGQYAVIFLHRQHSLQPFSRHYSHSTNPFLDLLEVVDGDGHDAAPPPVADGMLFPPVPAVSRSSSRTMSRNPSMEATPTLSSEERSRTTTIQIPPPHLGPMLSLVRSYKLVKSLGILHSIAFTTVDEYLFFLRGVSRVMGTAKDAEGKALGRRGMYYLAAAVSDFFIPRQRMVSFQSTWSYEDGSAEQACQKSEHKIQSGKGSLIIEMDQVPKVLKAMVDEWSNDGYIVSFKVRFPHSLLPLPLTTLRTGFAARNGPRAARAKVAHGARAVRAPGRDRQHAHRAQARGRLCREGRRDVGPHRRARARRDWRRWRGARD